jgi:hypothetical protein
VELVTDHLLQDRGEVVEDAGADVGSEGGPDINGSGGHSTSYCPASVTSSVTASRVSVVGMVGRGGASVVAASGSRNTIICR